MKDKADPQAPATKTTIWNMICSALAAFIGIQSDKNREKDFNQSSFIPFFITGVVLITLFFVGLTLIAGQISPD